MTAHAALLVLATVVAVAGCTGEKSMGGPIVDADGAVSGGRVDVGVPPDSRTVDGVWESSPWFSTMGPVGQWLEYPAFTTLVIHHTLGRPPTGMEVWVVPNSDPPGGAGNERFGAGAFPAAGPVAVTGDINDDYIEISNATAVPHFVRVVLH